jgi:hypothetical protein
MARDAYWVFSLELSPVMAGAAPARMGRTGVPGRESTGKGQVDRPVARVGRGVLGRRFTETGCVGPAFNRSRIPVGRRFYTSRWELYT